MPERRRPYHPALGRRGIRGLKKHVNFRYTEDGGASPYDYAKTPLAHDDLKIDINRLDDYELLSTEDILGE